MSLIKAVILLGLATQALAACNTTAGLGQDIQGGGRAIENSADQTKSKM